MGWTVKGEKVARAQKTIRHYIGFVEGRITTAESELLALEKLLKTIQSYQIFSRYGQIEGFLGWVDHIIRCLDYVKWDFEGYGEDIRKQLGVIRNHNRVFMSGL